MNNAREELLKQLPQSARIELANRYVEAMVVAESVAGRLARETKADVAYHAYLAGYDAAAENACQELLEENQALQSERVDMAIGQKRIAGLTRLLNEVFLVTAKHRDCDCGLCRAIETIND